MSNYVPVHRVVKYRKLKEEVAIQAEVLHDMKEQLKNSNNYKFKMEMRDAYNGEMIALELMQAELRGLEEELVTDSATEEE